MAGNVEDRSQERNVDKTAGMAERAETLRLNDGRILGIAEYGHPGGFPVLAFHGIPGSRRTFAFADTVARRLQIRLIAPERPGIGLSSPLAQREILDWPGDVAELVETLGLSSFGVIGLSGGGAGALPVVVAEGGEEALQHRCLVMEGEGMREKGEAGGMRVR